MAAASRWSPNWRTTRASCEDEGAPVWFRATFKPTQRISIDGVAGFNFDGELHLISSNGTTIAESDYDPAFVAGVFASIEF